MNDQLNGHKCIVFAIEHYNPLGIIRTLGKYGVNPVYIALPGRVPVASASRYVSKVHHVSTPNEGYEILVKEYGTGFDKEHLPFIFSSDDKTMEVLDKHFDELKNKFIFFNAGKTDGISKYMNKNNILALAKKHGLNILESRVCKCGEVPDNLEYPVITKSISPNIGGWKSDVHICYSKEELKEAYEKIKSPTVLVQKYIEKKNEYCMEGFSVAHGKESFIAIVSTYNYLLPGYYSPYMTVHNMNNEFLKKALSNMLADINFEGIFEIEFLIDQDERYYFSEINFRNATWSYAATIAGMPLPILWAECMLKNTIPDNIYKVVPDNFTAIVEPIDYAKRVKTGKIDVAEWLIDFKKAQCAYYYSVEDIAPFRLMIENMDHLG